MTDLLNFYQLNNIFDSVNNPVDCYSIKTAKLTLILYLLTLLLISCSQRQTQNKYSTQNKDTIYSTTTQQLKSNNIPDRVFDMTALKDLTVTGMDCDYGDHPHCWDLTEIPAGIKNLKHLTTLSLRVNEIRKIPIELSELKDLKTLDLSDNVALSSADNVEKITSLNYLTLYGCGLARLPDRIGDLINLKELGLVGNHIDQLEQARIKKALPKCIIRF